ncbi:unnamed protein product [Rhizoctonia solani]|uniref:Uncharacterized protein n=1 Tax=Rhizoctonia solani TaxID=456999 RepID=A0A8H3DL13_9AGAM|nr:unnamed protein product [Rhizoctonia solani]
MTTRRRWSNCPLTEADLCIGIDSLLSHIYDHVETAIQYCTERVLKLPKGRSDINVATTSPNGVGLLVLSRLEPYLMNSKIMKALTAYGKEIHERLVIIHCLVGYKLWSANQVMMDLVSGLYQKNVLQMTDQFVFGVFQDDARYFVIVAAAWRDGNIRVYKIAEHSLRVSIVRPFWLGSGQ